MAGPFSAVYPKIAHVSVDRDMCAVICDGVVHIPARKTYLIIEFLEANPGRVYSREQLLNALNVGDVYYRTIDSHVKRARRIVGHGWIITRVGLGYSWTTKKRTVAAPSNLSPELQRLFALYRTTRDPSDGL
jgi:DNA-binding response OmpR family regulator